MAAAGSIDCKQQQQQQDMNDVVNLNVGGKRYTTTRSTLCRDPDSMLAAMFSGSFKPGHTDCSESFFIDRDGDVFCHVLNYLRSLKLELPDDFKDYSRLLTEAEYFGLGHLQQLLCGSMDNKQCKKRFVEIWTMETAGNVEQFYHPHFLKTKTVMRITGPEAVIRKLELKCDCDPVQLTPKLTDNCRVMRIELPSNDYKLHYLAELTALGCHLVSHSSSVCCDRDQGNNAYRNIEQFILEFNFIHHPAAAAAAATNVKCSCSSTEKKVDGLQEKSIPILID